MEITVLHNEPSSRFEVVLDTHLSMVEYERSAGRIAFTHTEVPHELEGRGVASALARHVLQFARDNQLKVVPLCPFILSYIRKHKAEYADILAPGYEGI